MSTEVLAERVNNFRENVGNTLAQHTQSIAVLSERVEVLRLWQAKLFGLAISAGAVVGFTTTVLTMLIQQMIKGAFP